MLGPIQIVLAPASALRAGKDLLAELVESLAGFQTPILHEGGFHFCSQ